MQLSELYKPLTAHPFERTISYFEAEPCAALKPYIRCFWGTVHPFFAPQNGVSDLVIPDTCCDVIFTVNHTEGTIDSAFCGTGDVSFASYSYTQKPHLRSVFAIRFTHGAQPLSLRTRCAAPKTRPPTRIPISPPCAARSSPGCLKPPPFHSASVLRKAFCSVICARSETAPQCRMRSMKF